jgi:DNA-binding transcriptional MerR regulator
LLCCVNLHLKLSMAVYSIRELEKLSGIKAHTIRIWEKRYNLIEPHRTQTNIRYYTDNDLKKILNVAVLNRHGIKISNIAKLNDLELREEIISISKADQSQESAIDSMIVAMIDMDEYRLNAIIEKSISKTGFKATVTDLLYPFLEKVGILWQSGDVNPAQEHFVSNLIRQKIISATENLSGTYNPKAKKFLLMLPEGEWHEITLLFVYYLLREANHEVIYLGQSVPYSDVLATGASKSFDYIFISSTTTQPEFDFILYLKDLGGAFPDKKILYFSRFLGEKPSELSENHIQIRNLKDFTTFLEKLED